MLWFYRYALFKTLLEVFAFSITVNAVVKMPEPSNGNSFVTAKDSLKSVRHFCFHGIILFQAVLFKQYSFKFLLVLE